MVFRNPRLVALLEPTATPEEFAAAGGVTHRIEMTYITRDGDLRAYVTHALRVVIRSVDDDTRPWSYRVVYQLEYRMGFAGTDALVHAKEYPTHDDALAALERAYDLVRDWPAQMAIR